jgi:hypothetical protein
MIIFMINWMDGLFGYRYNLATMKNEARDYVQFFTEQYCNNERQRLLIFLIEINQTLF